MCTYVASLPVPSRRTTCTSLACVFRPMTPYATAQPASSSLCAKLTLRSSSKRALSSTRTATCFPFATALMRALMMGLSDDVRYSVALIATTRSSSAAASTNRCTVLPNEWNGWCSSTSCRRMAPKNDSRPSTAPCSSPGVVPSHAGHAYPPDATLCPTGSDMIDDRSSTGTSISKMSVSFRLSSRMRCLRINVGMPSSISILTNGAKRLSRISSEIMSSRSSASSSCLSSSALRVTRKRCVETTCMPPKRLSRFARTISSSGVTHVQFLPSVLPSMSTSIQRARLGGSGTMATRKAVSAPPFA
mmetsp:Transcript_12666/g.28758  ORF Transcript_12666/g.28758 Transcript_12666/m.28758 type:complete len:304 (-) Transcript_12666:940-1851(-)